MRRLLVLCLVLLTTACTSSPHIGRLQIDELREYRAARLAAAMRDRLVVTVDSQYLDHTIHGSEAGSQSRREHLAAWGRALGGEYGLRFVEHYSLPALGVDAFVFEAPGERVLQFAVRRLERRDGVRSVQRINVFRTQSDAALNDAPAPLVIPPGDPLAPLQTIPPEAFEQLHGIATGDGVLVAIVDTGLDLNHEDLRGARIEAHDLVAGNANIPAEMHATAVTGLILAQPDNGAGIRGIAPGASVLVLRACWQDLPASGAFCNTFTLAKALSMALERGADVVNLSLTGPMDPLLAQLVQNLLDAGVIVVAAYHDRPAQGPFPAEVPGVIAATARPVLAANPGPVFAPGDDVITLLPGDRYGFQQGSSISAAYVAGIACLFRQLDPGLRPAELGSVLRGEGVDAEGLDGLIEALRKAAQ